MGRGIAEGVILMRNGENLIKDGGNLITDGGNLIRDGGDRTYLDRAHCRNGGRRGFVAPGAGAALKQCGYRDLRMQALPSLGTL